MKFNERNRDPEGWKRARDMGAKIPCEARAYHVSAVLGAGLFVHGGVSGETQELLDDWHLFDCGLGVWIKVTIHDGEGDEQPPFVLKRKMHSLSPMVDPNISSEKASTRMCWTQPVEELTEFNGHLKHYGMYLFGGQCDNGFPHDDLWFIRPCLKRN